jgi:hypothetical protein
MRHVLLDKRDQRRKARSRVVRTGKLNDNSQGQLLKTVERGSLSSDIVGALRLRSRRTAFGAAGREGLPPMKQLLRSNDPVLLSYVSALLDGAGIDFMVADLNMSVLEGSIGALPRRVLVDGERLLQARKLLSEADLGHVIADDETA